MNNILKYWQLCELSSFISFSPITEKFISYEKTVSMNRKEKMYSIGEKTYYKVYLGFIKKDILVKYIKETIYQKYNLKDDGFEINLNSTGNSEYTYLGYLYVNSNLEAISENDNILYINPIFYILKEILEKKEISKKNYFEVQKNFNTFFVENWTPSKKQNYIYILDSSHIIEKCQKEKKSNYFYNNFPLNSIIVIPGEVRHELDTIKSYSKNIEKQNAVRKFSREESEIHRRQQDKEKKDFTIIQEKRINNNFNHQRMLDSKYDEKIVEIVQKYSQLNPNDFIIFLSTDNNQRNILSCFKQGLSQEYNTNSFYNKYENIFVFNNLPLKKIQDIHKSIGTLNKNDFLILLSFLKTRLLSKELSELFEPILKEEILFQKKFFSIKKIESFFEKPFFSFYYEELLKSPQNIALKYINEKQIKYLDIELSDNKLEISSLKNYFNNKSSWLTKHFSCLGQERVVNFIMNNHQKKSDGFLIGVNGPPGTGKTTLIKDIFSNLLIKKIELLKKNNFNLENIINFKGKHEILIVSNNNNAVENITKELPKFDEITFENITFFEKKPFFYLTKIATKFYDNNSFTFVSLNLGKKENVEKSKFKILKTIQEIKELNVIININKDISYYLNEFERIKNLISKKYLNMDKEIKRTDKKNLLIEKNFLYERKTGIEFLIEEMEKKKVTYQTIISENEKRISLKNKKILFIKRRKKLYQKALLVFLKEKRKCNILNINKKITLKKKIRIQKKRIKEENSNIFLTIKKINCLKNENIQILEKIVILNKKKDEKNQEKLLLIESLEKINFDLNKKEGARNYESIENLIKNNIKHSELHLKTLYIDNELFKYKQYLFYISLKLNELFIIKEIEKIEKYIKYYFYNIDSQIEDKYIKIYQKGFSALFCLFPIISSSLAATPSFLKNIDFLDFIICDEAGQSTPQSIYGVLRKTKQALSLGDPFQIEPIVSDLKILFLILEKKLNISKEYSLLDSSIQELFDYKSKYGTYYFYENQKKWVGFPLYVHRRCLEPMFSISNEIAYNNKMIKATQKLKKENLLNKLPESCWIDISSKEKDFIGNISKKEKDFLKIFFTFYKNILQTKEKNFFYIISPFKQKNDSILIYNVKSSNKNDLFGTVHTFQGKENYIVFFVLGGKTNASRKWASEKSNLLNVALTRAKVKIYIIGDYKNWSSLPYFDTLSKNLRKYTVEEFKLEFLKK